MNIKNSLKWSINDLTDKIHECYDLPTPIINIYDLISVLEGKLEFSNASPSAQSIVEKITDDKFCFKITISHLMTQENLRFQLASDIGHLFLHMGYVIDDEVWKSSNGVLRKYAGEMRLQADEFARSLLMPRKKFGEVVLGSYRGDNKYDLKIICDYFGTPLNQTLKRGIDLGYMKA